MDDKPIKCPCCKRELIRWEDTLFRCISSIEYCNFNEVIFDSLGNIISLLIFSCFTINPSMLILNIMNNSTSLREQDIEYYKVLPSEVIYLELKSSTNINSIDDLYKELSDLINKLKENKYLE